MSRYELFKRDHPLQHLIINLPSSENGDGFNHLDFGNLHEITHSIFSQELLCLIERYLQCTEKYDFHQTVLFSCFDSHGEFCVASILFQENTFYERQTDHLSCYLHKSLESSRYIEISVRIQIPKISCFIPFLIHSP